MTGSPPELRISRYTEDDAAEWDEFIADAPMATFLHSRRFLSYHGDRFDDESLLLRDRRERIVGVLPAAKDPNDAGLVVSHPGITYGGVLHSGSLAGAAMVEALAAVRQHYAERGFGRIRYKVVPVIYHRRPAEDDVYALTNLGATLYRCDLSTAIDLTDRGPVSDRRRRGARKASKRGVQVVQSPADAGELWAVLEENLARRHGARPTHTFDEIQLLLGRFPDTIVVVTAKLGDAVVAGVVLFITPRVVHAQYIAASEAGYSASALDAVLEHSIDLAAMSGRRFFDFGISTVDEGRVLNNGLHTFKSEFGGGGVAHLFYDLSLG